MACCHTPEQSQLCANTGTHCILMIMSGYGYWAHDPVARGNILAHTDA